MAQKGKKKEEEVTEEESSTLMNVLTVFMYAALLLFLASYLAFTYDPKRFDQMAGNGELAQRLKTVFQIVDEYSPFHEYAKEELSNDDAGGEDKVKNEAESERIFTKEELKQYDGSQEGKGPFLAILGLVFDVSAKPETYGPGGGYGFFSGVDGSRAYVSGQFDEDGLIDDVAGLSNNDYLGLVNWVDFYAKSKQYHYVGKVVGRFYDEEGRETDYKRKFDGWLEEAKAERDTYNEEKKLFPPCNTEWSKAKGSRVWCSKKSGGIDRNWIGR